ncbi:hypothetical protein HMPREF9440_01094 [Sutterella parvirubra YIT 11816]|uniref:Uncharacterized protein n=1 Tax=Sutterella parvirubra YIT 11816 TaxID=762967 RepID=H3KED1_9BURK|nr:hypothetical protein HMPREF9440_01094 [Sutterella parvirubra YIT 11816]
MRFEHKESPLSLGSLKRLTSGAPRHVFPLRARRRTFHPVRYSKATVSTIVRRGEKREFGVVIWYYP